MNKVSKKQALKSLHITKEFMVKNNYGLGHIQEVIDYINQQSEGIKKLEERTTPKKPKHYYELDSHYVGDYSGNFEIEIYECPNFECKGLLKDERENWNFVEFPYCVHCGQALDWSEKEVLKDE
jgi:hypothetical protein